MASAENHRVLIVDDDAGMRGVIAWHFRRKGYEVEQAEAAEEVIDRFATGRGRYDVVVTDVHLPGASGVDLARQIRHVWPEQPVIVMTGDADASIAHRALHSGATGFLIKPFEFFELDAVVDHALRWAGALRARPQATAPRRVERTARMRLRVLLVAGAMLALAWLAGSVLIR
jgi:two-component system nitrogen regulation response regulator GlnG